MRAFVILVFLSLWASGCSVFSMDAFEDWESASTDYLVALPEDVRDGFADDAHALAYALAVDCFKNEEPLSGRDKSVQDACETAEWGWLSDLMTLEDLCDHARSDGNVDVARFNGGRICG